MFDTTTIGAPPKEDLMFTDNGDGFFRMSFSSASYEDMQKGVAVIGKEIRHFFEHK